MQFIDLRIHENDPIPVAIVEFDVDGTIKFQNERFRSLFFSDVPEDDPRHGFDVRALLQVLARHFDSDPPIDDPRANSVNGDPPTDQPDKLPGLSHPEIPFDDVATTDCFHPWAASGVPTSCRLNYQFAFADDVEDRTKSTKRHFQVFFRKRTTAGEDDGDYRAVIETVTVERRNQEMGERIGKALSAKLREVLVEGADEKTRGLNYAIVPEIPPVGGDFVFDWSVKKTSRVSNRLRITMFGDAESSNYVAGLMSATVGTILKSICLKPKELFGGLKETDNHAKVLAHHLNKEIIEHNTTGSRGVDGMVMVTDLTRSKLHLSDGKFDVYVFEAGIEKQSKIERIGDMYLSDRGYLPKSFGQESDQDFSTKMIDVTRETLVIGFSDGVGDVLQDNGYGGGKGDLRDFIFETLSSLKKKPKDPVRLVKKLGIALQNQLEYGRAKSSNDAPLNLEAIGREDDELIVVFAPMLRPWKGRDS